MENLHKAKRCTRPHRFLREESLGNQIFGRRDNKLDLCVHLIHILSKLRLGAATIGRFHNESLRTRMPFLISVVVQIIMPIAVNE
jgi:hypothetical protein